MSPLAPVLQTWAKVSESIPLKRVEVALAPLRTMVEAVERDAAAAVKRVEVLIETSGRVAFPGVGDPLGRSLQVATHRWLAKHREESYSDWLAWIIERQSDPSLILPLFGLDRQTGRSEEWSVEREVVTSYGRLDLVIRNSRLGTLCVEVKTESEPGEDQLERYLKWLNGIEPRLGLVLLAVDRPEGGIPEKCRFCSWKHVAQTLRAWARDWLGAKPPRIYDAVMTLAFCGAIEGNLLCLGRSSLNAIRTADYLEEVLGVRDATETNR